jgi:type IX secretion system PorP/SprF family membrane protein
MKKIIFLTLSFILIGMSINAQSRYFDERYTYTHNYLYPVLVNPGATGSTGNHQVVFNYRNTWAGFEKSPKTFTFSYDGNVGNRLGFGALLFSDSYGDLGTTKGQLSFSYTIDSPTNKVGFGLSTEYIRHSLSGSAVTSPLINIDDPVLLQRLDGNSFFDASFGVYGLYDGKISYGLALPSLVSSSINEDAPEGDSDFGFILNLGYKFESKENDIVAEPSIFIKQFMNVPLHVDLNLRLKFLDERLTGGVSYTIGAEERLGFLIGTKVNSLNFFYSYNVSRHDFQQYNNGSHDLTVAFNIAAFNSTENEK